MRRGSGGPVHTGRGVTGGAGVKTVRGATLARAGSNGAGEATRPPSGTRTSSRRAA